MCVCAHTLLTHVCYTHTITEGSIYGYVRSTAIVTAAIFHCVWSVKREHRVFYQKYLCFLSNVNSISIVPLSPTQSWTMCFRCPEITSESDLQRVVHWDLLHWALRIIELVTHRDHTEHHWPQLTQVTWRKETRHGRDVSETGWVGGLWVLKMERGGCGDALHSGCFRSSCCLFPHEWSSSLPPCWGEWGWDVRGSGCWKENPRPTSLGNHTPATVSRSLPLCLDFTWFTQQAVAFLTSLYRSLSRPLSPSHTSTGTSVHCFSRPSVNDAPPEFVLSHWCMLSNRCLQIQRPSPIGGLMWEMTNGKLYLVVAQSYG